MKQVATNLLCEMPVLASERAHHVGVIHILQSETVGEVGRERGWKRLGEADPIVLVKTEGEGDAAVPRPTEAGTDSADLLVLWRCHAVLRRESVVREAHLTRYGV